MDLSREHPRYPWAFDMLWPSALIMVSLALLAMTTEQNWPIMAPMSVTVVGAMTFLWVLRLREHTVPFFEIGTVYVAVVVLYTLYPLAGFLINGLAYTPFNDSRLFYAQPTPQEMGTIGWYHVVHLLSFIGAYLIVRGRLLRQSPAFQMPDRISLIILVVFYLATRVFFFLLDSMFGLTKSGYIASYLMHKDLPFGLAQIYSLLRGARLTLEVAILAGLFGGYRKYWPLILALLGSIILTCYLELGSRTGLVLLLMATAMIYHYRIRIIPSSIIVTGGLLVLALFVSFGLLRMDWLFFGKTESLNPFAYSCEFEAIFANAYDCRFLLNNAAVELPPGFYLADLLVMIPRQFLPFDKINPSEWYVNTFYPSFADSGGGLAFGTISESILGGGWLDLMGRGAALGLILALIHRHCVLRHPSFWTFVFYVWLSIQMYQSFRHTTFFPAYFFVYHFFWVMAGTKILASILKRGTRAQAKIQTQPV